MLMCMKTITVYLNEEEVEEGRISYIYVLEHLQLISLFTFYLEKLLRFYGKDPLVNIKKCFLLIFDSQMAIRSNFERELR